MPHTASNRSSHHDSPGGGARAAYRNGVLAAIADLLPNAAHKPFPVIVGTSAGRLMRWDWPVVRCTSLKRCAG